MKIYKVNTSSKVIMVIFGIFFILLTLWVYSFDSEARNSFRIFYYIIAILIFLIFSVGGAYCMHRLRIQIDDKRIELFYLKSHSRLSLNWVEIKELRANFILFPESPIIILTPLEGLNKKRVEFLMQGLPLDLLHNILEHLLPSTKLSLYPHLEKMLQRKPDSKRKVVVIAGVLIFILLAGFLLSWLNFNNVAGILSIMVLIGLLVATSIWHK